MVIPIDKALLFDSISRSVTAYAIITIDLARKVTSWNNGAQKIIGYAAEEMIGHSVDIIFTEQDKAGGVPAKELHTAKTKGCASDYRWHITKSGSFFWADGVMTLLHDDEGAHIGFVKILSDITERARTERKMLRIANQDRLTGLANRLSFEVKLNELLALSKRHKQHLALMALDLDKFKNVNDTLGHECGDALLKQVAQRLSNAVRETDFLARLGGDEFMVIQANVNYPEASVILADKIIESLTAPFHIGNNEIVIGCSIGIAVAPDDANDSRQLMSKADLALYRAKQDTKGHYHFFTQNMDTLAQERNLHMSELRKASQDKEYCIHYQPAIDAVTGKPVAVEALLRFSNEVLAGLPLENILSLAVQSGLMTDIDFQIMRDACRQLSNWHRHGFKLRLSINVFSRQLLDPEITARMQAILEECQLAPECLEIELSEQDVIGLGEEAEAILIKLRMAGFAITMDDFGIGYGSLRIIQNLPFNNVKLDRSLIRHVPASDQQSQIVQSLIPLCQASGATVIAEGVETEAQAEFLRQAGCQLLQGYCIAKPMQSGDLELWLKERFIQ